MQKWTPPFVIFREFLEKECAKWGQREEGEGERKYLRVQTHSPEIMT